MIVRYKNMYLRKKFLDKIAFQAFNSSFLIPVDYGSMNSTL